MKSASLLLAVAITLFSLSSANASIMYGALSNFDCINDTGSTAHGFEIELDGIKTSDVVYTFGAPYNRYGTPTITTDGTNTFVTYASTYSNGAWATGTNSGTYPATGGHSLFNGGDPNYPNVPGDHFGVSLTANPTNTVYHWLLDGGNGKLVQAGTAVQLPAPIMTLVPPANPANNLAVQAVINAPAPEGGQAFGTAIWAKVFTTVVENPGQVKLNDLVLGNAAVPPNSETEVEWQLLQSVPGRPDLAEKMDNVDVAGKNESVTRRYEFYSYTGGYDPENHEALTDTHSAGVVGNYLGNQNVAINFAQAVPEPSSVIMSGLGLSCVVTLAYRRRNRKSDQR